MLQGLIADLNRKSRASGLHLPASENGWGSALASTWMTGFPLRTGFARGFPEFDPWRFDVARMIAAGEADLHLRISASTVQPQKKRNRMALIALAKTHAAGRAALRSPSPSAKPASITRRWSIPAAPGRCASIEARAASRTAVRRDGHPADRRVMSRRGGAAMLTKIAGGDIIDPVNGRVGKGDLWISDDNIVDGAGRRAPPTGPIDAAGCIVMAGRHRHPFPHRRRQREHGAAAAARAARRAQPRPAATPLSNAGWSTFETGCLYAKMGFTTVVEPAMSPGAALHTHLELADIPIIDKATLAILGNDDFLLSMIRDDASPQMIEDYVAWTVASTRALGVKVINAGAAAAFKENVRTFSLDDVVPSYGVSSRKIVKTLQAAVDSARRPASAACPLQQSRRAGSGGHGGRDDRGGRRACRCISRISSSTATARRASASSPRPRRGLPNWSTRRRKSPSMSAR